MDGLSPWKWSRLICAARDSYFLTGDSTGLHRLVTAFALFTLHSVLTQSVCYAGAVAITAGWHHASSGSHARRASLARLGLCPWTLVCTTRKKQDAGAVRCPTGLERRPEPWSWAPPVVLGGFGCRPTVTSAESLRGTYA